VTRNRRLDSEQSRLSKSLPVRRALAARCWSAHALTLALAALLAEACVYDGGDRCGDNQILLDSATCVCAPGYVVSGPECVSCGENEVPSPTGCACIENYSRATPESPCEPRPGGLGDPCDAQTPCTNPSFDHCQMGSAASGYCTSSGCAATVDCTGGYACDTAGSPSFCKRPPVGAGKMCSSPADCADGDATFCDTFMTQSCLVMGCTVTPNDCFEGTECCDLSAFGLPAPICVAPGSCPP
jgi:hypothetical protein